MPSVNLCFQVHQPYRLKRVRYFDEVQNFDYFDEQSNQETFERVAKNCYIPTNEILLGLINLHEGNFKVSFSLTVPVMQQMEKYAPEALDSFKKLAATGCVEFLAETSHHTLASVSSEQEFQEQIAYHSQLIKRHFDLTPQVFRNTELIYSDNIARLVSEMGFQGILAEGVNEILAWRSPNYVYCSKDSNIKLLLRNYQLSDDIAFRFSNKGWQEYPLTADKYAAWIHATSGVGDVVNLFMDYETFGEHHKEDTGILQFLQHLPSTILSHPDWSFSTPSEAIAAYETVAELSFSKPFSWADKERDLSAWLGNKMQKTALRKLYEVENIIRGSGDLNLFEVWRKLQTSDHFYYMSTKSFSDGDVHSYFSPYEGPYDAFVNYMNILKDFHAHIHRTQSLRFEQAV